MNKILEIYKVERKKIVATRKQRANTRVCRYLTIWTVALNNARTDLTPQICQANKRNKTQENGSKACLVAVRRYLAPI